jgi:hypothetical protein
VFGVRFAAFELLSWQDPEDLAAQPKENYVFVVFGCGGFGRIYNF